MLALLALRDGSGCGRVAAEGLRMATLCRRLSSIHFCSQWHMETWGLVFLG
jgi:hypothetical protein